MQKTQSLVGSIHERDLIYVDSYVSDNVGIFIPSVGFCSTNIMPQQSCLKYFDIVPILFLTIYYNPYYLIFLVKGNLVGMEFSSID